MLKQISVFLENSPGRLYETTKALRDAKINLRAISLAAAHDFGVARMLVSNVATARRVMMEKQLPARVDDVVVVEIEDEPGALVEVLEPLYQAGINLKYMYAFATLVAKKAVIVFAFGDNLAAIETLKKNGVRMLGAADLGIVETAE